MWDNCHDFIQWLFPLPVASKFFAGDDCPVLTGKDAEEVWNNHAVLGNLASSSRRFLSFMGLDLHHPYTTNSHLREADYSVRVRVGYSSHNFSEQSKYWLKANDHNHLRINRMLQCLVLFGLDNLAKAIFRCLIMIKCEFDDCITDETMVYWRNALTGYSY